MPQRSILSPREQEVLKKVAEGRTSLQIGEDLFISKRTVDFHIQNMLKKATASNRMELLRKLHEMGAKD